MVIDIISYTDMQLSFLSVEQLEEVRRAQIKKNAYIQEKTKICNEEKYRLQRNGTFVSPLYSKYCAKVESEYAQKIEELREGLLFYLQFTSRPNGTLEQEAPYIVNYALPMQQRLDAVRGYYESAYTDERSIERFEVFQEDKVAVVYLGEYYSAVYSIYKQRAKDHGWEG